MKTTATVLFALAAASAAVVSTPAAASLYPSYIRSHYPKAIQPLLLRENALDDECQGSGGGNAAGQRACRQRDILIKQLETKGWCWGSTDRDALDMNMTWLPCKKDRTRS